MTDLYASQSISGYNPDAPPDDGSQTASNLATYDQIKTELVDPVKTLAEAINSQVNTAFATLDAAVTVNADSSVNFPLQPLVSVYSNTTQSNLVPGGATTVNFNTEIVDVGGDFNTATYAFTAPVTGYYLIMLSLYLAQVDSGATNVVISVVTSNRTYSHTYIPSVLSADHDYQHHDSLIADMDVNDTLSVTVTVTGGASQTDIVDGQQTTRLMIKLAA